MRERERERKASFRFSKSVERERKLAQKREKVTAQRSSRVGEVAGADPRAFSTKEPMFSVGDRVNCDIQTRGTTSNEAGAGD